MIQSNYVPWKGYFDIINDVDIFVFYDDVQYTTRDWRNRNMIKPKGTPLWITVPVKNESLRTKKIFEVEIDNTQKWQLKHMKSITLSYSKAPYLKDYMGFIEKIYVDSEWTSLVELNRFVIKGICKLLGITTEFVNLEDLNIDGNKDGERIIKVCRELNCRFMLNGPSARSFIDQSLFDDAGIEIDYKIYNYPEYRQMGQPFEHKVSILDLLFNTGKEAPYYIWGWKECLQ